LILTLTRCPENLECRTGVDGEGGVEVDVRDAGLAGWGGFDPGIADAEDVGCVARAVQQGFADGATGLAARVGRRCAADEMCVFPPGEGGGES